jgi:hypothetical protein
MKKNIGLIFFIMLSTLIFADEGKIITVMDFETSGVAHQEMTLFVDYISSSISDNADYILIDRRQRESILVETQFSNSGCADESCAIEIGRLLSATEMIVGSLGSIGSLYILNIKLIEVETGRTLRDVSERYDSIEKLVIGSDDVVAELFEGNQKFSTSTDNQPETQPSEKVTHNTEIEPQTTTAKDNPDIDFTIGIAGPTLIGGIIGFDFPAGENLYWGIYGGVFYSGFRLASILPSGIKVPPRLLQDLVC